MNEIEERGEGNNLRELKSRVWEKYIMKEDR